MNNISSNPIGYVDIEHSTFEGFTQKIFLRECCKSNDCEVLIYRHQSSCRCILQKEIRQRFTEPLVNTNAMQCYC